MRKYKTIMELIFIFLIPLILILSGINLKEEQITTQTGYEWNTYIQYENKILVEMGEYKNIIQNFNIWDEQWELGVISGTNGSNINSTTRIRSKNYIPINENTSYYINIEGTEGIQVMYLRYYDNNHNFIGIADTVIPTTIQTPAGASYLRFCMSEDYGNKYENNICINISVNWANGNYVPYGKPLIIYSEQDLSGQNNRIYTPFGSIKNLILDNLKIKQTTTIDILFDYTILWFLMFILWHVLYLFFDMLIHLFIDWGHKEKEKING